MIEGLICALYALNQLSSRIEITTVRGKTPGYLDSYASITLLISQPDLDSGLEHHMLQR